ncbi:MAG: M48 family metallopeptidase [Chloroflexota bacterium]
MRRGRRFSPVQIGIALIVVAISLITYFASSEFNPITEETQQVALSPAQEIAMGLQAVPEMSQAYGGLLRDDKAQVYLDKVCGQLVANSEVSSTDWPFECHLLADTETINAFALPGGQLFITAALFNQLETEGQLAAVMAHEIVHVVARHAAEQIADQQLTQGLTGAAVIAAYNPDDPNGGLASGQMAALVGALVNLRYGRDDELQSDRLGVQFMSEAGYDPRAMVRVMEILEAASDGQTQPEFFSTHPNPDNRIERILEAIAAQFPNGIPEGLKP